MKTSASAECVGGEVSEAPERIGVSAIVTAFERLPETLRTLDELMKCDPPPEEILVHVDGNQAACAKEIKARFPFARVILSEQNVGPGGGRNQLLAAAQCSYVASFDDDSFPLQRDYFRRIRKLFDRYPNASILAATIFHREEVRSANETVDCAWIAAFGGGGCAYRRQEFMKTTGYVPLAIAYGMEEVDLALRIIDSGGRILSAPSLQVFHDTDRSHHADPKITAFSIANIALLVYLRYPVSYWPMGMAQIVRRVWWLIRARRLRGIVEGLLMIPRHLITYRHYRSTVSPESLRRILALRRRPQPV